MEAYGTIKVTEQNIMQQMSKVESKVNEIVHIQMNNNITLDNDDEPNFSKEESKVNVMKMLDKMQTDTGEDNRHMNPNEFKASLCKKLAGKE